MRVDILPLESCDAEHIVKWNDGKDSDFLTQWAGRGYHHPITAIQIKKRIAQQLSSDYELYKIVGNGFVIGTIELMQIDLEAKRANVGRFLLDPALTGKGHGTAALREFITRMFAEKPLEKIGLTVFEFNLAAIRCYRKTGFEVIDKKNRPNGWVAVEMEITNKEELCDENSQ